MADIEKKIWGIYTYDEALFLKDDKMAIRYSYELNLQPAPEGNPFMEILKLVWEEYEAVLREKDLVLPWFKVLGWA